MRKFPIACVVAGCALVSCTQQPAQNANGQSFEEKLSAQLIANPEIVEAALIELRDRKVAEKDASTAKLLNANSKSIQTDPKDYSLGPADAPITIVEYFDYRCGPCRGSAEWLTSLPAKYNGKVKVVFKEFPILSDQSQQGAIAALAAGRQGKYVEMHKALMEDTSDMQPEDLTKIAKQLNLDVAQFTADLNDKALAKQVGANIELATKVGIDSTPSFIIGDKLFSGGDRTKIEEKLAKLSAT